MRKPCLGYELVSFFEVAGISEKFTTSLAFTRYLKVSNCFSAQSTVTFCFIEIRSLKVSFYDNIEWINLWR